MQQLRQRIIELQRAQRRAAAAQGVDAVAGQPERAAQQRHVFVSVASVVLRLRAELPASAPRGERIRCFRATAEAFGVGVQHRQIARVPRLQIPAFTREFGVVLGVENDIHIHTCAGAGARNAGGQRIGAQIEMIATRERRHRHFAPTGQIQAQRRARFPAAVAVVAADVVVVDQRLVFADPLQRWPHEGVAAQIQRLAPFGERTVAVAQTRFQQQIAAEAIELALAVARADLVFAVTLEIVLHEDAELQRAVLFPAPAAGDVGEHGLAVRIAVDGVIGAREFAQAIEPAQFFLDFFRVHRIAGLRTQIDAHRVVVHRRSIHQLDPINVADRLQPRQACVAPPRIGFGRYPKRLQPRQRRHRRLFAQRHALVEPCGEIGRTHIVQSGNDQHIARVQSFALAFGFLQHHCGDHLVGDAERIEQLLAFFQRRADIHRNDPLRAPALRDLHRQIQRHAAVDQRLLPVTDRRQCARHRHAGAHRVDQIAMIHHHRIPGFQIGADRAERNRQIVETRDVRARQQRRAQRHRKALTFEHRRRHAQLAVAQAQPAFRQKTAVFGHAPLGERAAVDAVGEHRVPVQRAQLGFDFGRTHAAGVQTADHRAHAGAHDAVHRNALALQHLDDADVRHAARTAAAEHQTRVEAGGPRPRRIGAL